MPVIEQGIISPYSTIDSGSTYEIRCDSGFVITGPSSMVCTDGTLSESPSCPPVATVTCDGYGIKLFITEKISFDTILLNDKECEFKGDSQEIRTDLDKCGTTVFYNNSHVIYKNQMIGISSKIDYSNGITRGGELKISFECSFNRTGATKYASWEVKGAAIVEKVTGEGSLRFLLDIYEDATYANKVVNFPFQLTLNANINMQVTLDSLDPDQSLGVVRIQAKDSETEEDGNLSYDLVKEGCIVDSTFKFIETDSNLQPHSDPKSKRFIFKAFSFLDSQTPIYIHAVIKVCSFSDNSFGCTDLCLKNRRKRFAEVSSDLNGLQFHIYQGPIVPSHPVEIRVPMTFTKTFVEDQKLNNGEELILDVHVIAKPVPERVTWKLDDTDLVDNKATIFIEESFDPATYITTYTLKLVDLKVEQSGVITVELTSELNETISDSMTLTVLDELVLGVGVKLVPGILTFFLLLQVLL
ncbi:ZP domain-containing protein-like [Bolinopsis microptera]|uniref:ZP domain-containing protein-like n=1 Tax=Bolinopsis microptera TaxID=2820187 RepID=UPI0030790D75